MISQVRANTHPTFMTKLRNWYWSGKLSYLGENTHIESNVHFMRCPEKITIGNNVILKEGSRICPCNRDASISIGENTTIGYNTMIFASEKIQIGKDCLITPNVHIVDSEHGIERETRINEQPLTTLPVIIGNDVWIGTGATILSGVRILSGAVIAAGAVVNGDIPGYEIWGGVPARKIGMRQSRSFVGGN